jgi:uncharacterized membrane protein
MDDLNEMKEIWMKAKTDSLPGMDEMLQIIEKHKYKKLTKIVIMMVAAVVSVAIMVGVVFYYKITMITTLIGKLLIILAGIILVISKASSLTRYYNLDASSNKDFIQFLERTRERQIFYYRRTQVAAAAIIFVGLLFYIYEMVHKNEFLLITCYLLLVTFIMVLWLIVRPRTFKREAKKMNDKIERLKTLSNQINE